MVKSNRHSSGSLQNQHGIFDAMPRSTIYFVEFVYPWFHGKNIYIIFIVGHVEGRRTTLYITHSTLQVHLRELIVLNQDTGCLASALMFRPRSVSPNLYLIVHLTWSKRIGTSAQSGLTLPAPFRSSFVCVFFENRINHQVCIWDDQLLKMIIIALSITIL